VTGNNRTPGPAPPWSQVIATTIRLWWQRRGRAQESRSPQRRAYRRAGLAALVVALVAASAAIAHLATTSAAADSQHGQAGASGPTARELVVAAANRSKAAAWIVTQVGPTVIVSCDPLMCAALTQHGFPAANVATLGPDAGDPLGSSIVVSTTAVRSELGTRLASVYAPLVIASFGSGRGQVQVRVVAPDGTAAYLAAEKADLRARETAGHELLGNANVWASVFARGQLAAGQVDARLLITLGALAHRYPVAIREFGDAGPGADSAAPLRSMDIAAAGALYRGRVLAFLRAQRSPLRPLTFVHGIGTTTVITIEFTAPSPLGLLSQN
jgi:hypothetical protein